VQTPGASAYLQLRGLHKRFASFSALRDVSLDIAQGEFVCFLGPSGCGKTTLLRIIAGLEAQSAGQLLLNGRDISHLPPAQRDYGIVFQSYALFPNLTVAANVAYGLVSRKLGRALIAQRVSELLQLVGLPGSGTHIQRSCRAASNSALRWRARWPRNPACCCWMSPYRRWMRWSVCGCARRFAICSKTWA